MSTCRVQVMSINKCYTVFANPNMAQIIIVSKLQIQHDPISNLVTLHDIYNSFINLII